MRKFGVLLALLAALSTACGEEEPPEAAGPATMEVRAADYTFAAPASAAAGAVEITLTNAGPEPHQAQLFKLNDGATAATVIAAAKKDPSGLEVKKLGAYAGGPNAVDANETQVATATLDAGNYVFMCLVPNAKGQAHAGLGMVKALTVEENDETPTAEAGDYTAATKDYDFTFPSSWTGSITVTNEGKEDHEFQVMQIAEGKTAADYEAFFRGGEEPAAGPPPFATQGGVAVIPPGGTGTFDADLAPGTYYLQCFVASPAKKAPHFALGMMKKFEVKE